MQKFSSNELKKKNKLRSTRLNDISQEVAILEYFKFFEYFPKVIFSNTHVFIGLNE